MTALPWAVHYLALDAERLEIRAHIESVRGYSAHADQQNLFDFIRARRARCPTRLKARIEPWVREVGHKVEVTLGVDHQAQ